MTKGKTGLSLAFYAVFAFLLALIGQTTLCGVLLGFVILVEKDEWLTKQVIQAFGLTICLPVVRDILDAVNIVSKVPVLGNLTSGLFSLIISIISIIIFIFIILALTKVAKGKDANIPLFSKIADWAVGSLEANTTT